MKWKLRTFQALMLGCIAIPFVVDIESWVLRVAIVLMVFSSMALLEVEHHRIEKSNSANSGSEAKESQPHR